MPRSGWWWLSKVLEGVGLLVILVGVSLSITLGLEEESLESMAIEMKGLALGAVLFLAGILIERRIGSR